MSVVSSPGRPSLSATLFRAFWRWGPRLQASEGLENVKRRRVQLRRPAYWVMGQCPRSKAEIRTHAKLTQPQFENLRDNLTVWCPHCKAPHVLRPAVLELAMTATTATATLDRTAEASKPAHSGKPARRRASA